VGLVEIFDGVCSTYATVFRDQDYAPAHDSPNFWQLVLWRHRAGSEGRAQRTIRASNIGAAEIPGKF